MTRLLICLVTLGLGCTESMPVFEPIDGGGVDSSMRVDAGNVDSGEAIDAGRDSGQTEDAMVSVDTGPPEPPECGTAEEVGTLEDLLALIPAEFGRAGYAAARRATADLVATAAITVSAGDIPVPSECGPPECLGVKLWGAADNVSRDDDTVTIEAGATFRMRFNYEFLPPIGFEAQVTFEPPCSASCESDERRCGKDNACYLAGRTYCGACEGSDPDICACRTPVGIEDNGAECTYITGDVGNSGVCEDGLCVNMLSPGECCVGDTVSWSYSGGLRAFEDSYDLVGCDQISIEVRYFDGMTSRRSCRNELLGCSASGITPADVADAIAHADVAAAVPGVLYGQDSRPVDGSILQVSIGGGAEILIGDPCTGGTGLSCERQLPEGLQELASVLSQLSSQERMRGACATLLN